jgi:poly(U)-specific endoribonuclease
MSSIYLVVLACLYLGDLANAQTNEEIRVISEQIWNADSNRINGNDVQYSINGPRLFTYVNEARFVGTYARMIDLFDNYITISGTPEVCDSVCQAEVEAFLDAILQTQPIVLLHNFLYGHGLAGQTLAEFKEELRQYFFMPYTRSGGPLDSSGFEHVFTGEIDDGIVKGFHNWVQAYYAEQANSAQDWVYGPYQATCPNEVQKFGFNWYGYQKSVTSMFMRTSPEVEIALYTLCLTTRIGTSCPVRRNGVDLFMTVWDMTGLPKTIGSAYPNC